MYAYEVQREDEFVNCFYPTVNKFLEKDNNDLLYCIVLYCIVNFRLISTNSTVLFLLLQNGWCQGLVKTTILLK